MKIYLNVKESCCGFSLRTGTLVIGILSLVANVRVIISDLEIGAEIGSWFNLLVIIPMSVCSALVVVVAVRNRLPKLLIPWIVLSVLEMFFILFMCYIFMLLVGQVFQPRSIEKFLFVTLGFLLLAAVLLFQIWFVVFSYYRKLLNGMKKYPQPDDLPLHHYYTMGCSI